MNTRKAVEEDNIEFLRDADCLCFKNYFGNELSLKHPLVTLEFVALKLSLFHRTVLKRH